MITILAPDVVGVQEVGSPRAFDDLISRLNASASNNADRYTGQLSSHPDRRGIRVGFLSKTPILESHDLHSFPASGLVSVPGGIDNGGHTVNITTFGRGVLGITVEMKAGFPVTIFCAHLKSKLLTYPSTNGPRFAPRNENERTLAGGAALMKRTGEAAGLRVKATEVLNADADRALIVLGDLNDVPEAATTQILLGPSGSQIGTGGFNRADKGDKTRLFSLAPLIPAERRFSRIHQGQGELIDHILVSERLLPGKPHTLPHVDSHMDILDSSLPSLTDDPRDRQGKPGSDHAPITATFDLTAFP